ncbi:MAG TPA: spermidine/putrescine ABC transporter substrate-binding protein [Gaiella sp.]|jgi:spermidine/putrescine transport system substrate-binding protein|nr:spermidine/putrescine ABC transporter substrate-binding protein [Gaiella sp.]
MNRTWRIALAVLALGAALVLAACGGDDGGLEEGASDEETQTAAAEPIGGDWTISNWPLYIDKQTVSDFDKKVGANTKYIEDINDNFEFFGKLQPQLKNGESGGRSMFVVTDYMVKIMHDLGYLQDYDQSAIPNVEKNLLPSLESPDFDPNRDFSVPWQSGFTGIIINTELAPEIDSIEDLFDPKYKGKVTFLGDMYDDVTLVLKMDGVDPADATEEEWMKAIDQIDEAANSGQIRDFTGNAYAGPLVKGDLVAAVGWSGDAIQLQADNPNIKWIRPAEGCNLWSDNMVIPVGAPNPGTAQAFANYVYDPKNQAQIAAYVNYVTPVEGTKEILAKQDPKLANNQLIFPDEQFTADCTPQAVPDPSFEDKVTEEYQSVITG